MSFFSFSLSSFSFSCIKKERKSTDNIENPIKRRGSQCSQWIWNRQIRPGAGVTASVFRVPTRASQKRLLGLRSACPRGAAPARWDLRVCERAPGRLSESTKKAKKKEEKTGFPLFSQRVLPPATGKSARPGKVTQAAPSSSESQGGRSSAERNATWRPLCFYVSPKKRTNPFFLSVVMIPFLFSSSSFAAETKPVHTGGGFKRPTALSFSSHIRLMTSSRFSVYFLTFFNFSFFPPSNTIQWVWRRFLQQRNKNKVSFFAITTIRRIIVL